MRIYLDACCLNRPFDDQSQPRIRLEAEAVLLILRARAQRRWLWLGSDVLYAEAVRIRDLDRRKRIESLLATVDQNVELQAAAITRSHELSELGLRSWDALHIACAEAGGADVMLTTDDGILSVAVRHRGLIRLRIENPRKWIEEIEWPR